MMKYFANPIFLLIGIVVVAGLILFFQKMRQKRTVALHQFSSPKLAARLICTISNTERFCKEATIIVAIFFIFIALARPQYGYQWENVKRKGIDILFAIDTSLSMLAEDVKPNRLQRTKMAIYDFVNRLDGDRVGLLPFAGSAYLMCPLTMDYHTFEESLDSIDTTLIPEGGTNIARAIHEAEKVLSESSNHKILIIITDGETLEGNAVASAQEKSKEGLVIYTIGVGSKEGELIPLPTKSSFSGGFTGGLQNENNSIIKERGGFITDSNGKLVYSKLDSASLKQIAEVSGGIYAPLLSGENGGEEGLDIVYQKKLKLIPKEELAERRRKVPKERFQWPLAGAIFLLIVEFLIGERRRKGKDKKRKIIKSRVQDKIVGILLLVSSFCILLPQDLTALEAPKDNWTKKSISKSCGTTESSIGKAKKYFQELMKKTDEPILQYNLGTSSFKKKEFQRAVQYFNEALKSQDLSLQQKAYYNRGCSLYYKGSQMIQSNPQGTIADWEKALQSLQAATHLNPNNKLGNKLAKGNYALIEEKLKELKEQEKKKKEENKKQKDGDQKSTGESNSNKKNKKSGRQKNNKKEYNRQSVQQSQDTIKKTSEDKGKKQLQEGDEKEVQQRAGYKRKEQGQQNKGGKDTSSTQKDFNKDKNQQISLNKENDQVRQTMNKEEAEQLLNSLQSDEEILNFAPAKQINEQVDKNW